MSLWRVYTFNAAGFDLEKSTTVLLLIIGLLPNISRPAMRDRKKTFSYRKKNSINVCKIPKKKNQCFVPCMAHLPFFFAGERTKKGSRNKDRRQKKKPQSFASCMCYLLASLFRNPGRLGGAGRGVVLRTACNECTLKKVSTSRKKLSYSIDYTTTSYDALPIDIRSRRARPCSTAPIFVKKTYLSFRCVALHSPSASCLLLAPKTCFTAHRIVRK